MVLLNSDVKIRHFRYPEKLPSKVSKPKVLMWKYNCC